jgi:hypothetical protein
VLDSGFGIILLEADLSKQPWHYGVTRTLNRGLLQSLAGLLIVPQKAFRHPQNGCGRDVAWFSLSRDEFGKELRERVVFLVKLQYTVEGRAGPGLAFEQLQRPRVESLFP